MRLYDVSYKTESSKKDKGMIYDGTLDINTYCIFVRQSVACQIFL